MKLVLCVSGLAYGGGGGVPEDPWCQRTADCRNLQVYGNPTGNQFPAQNFENFLRFHHSGFCSCFALCSSLFLHASARVPIDTPVFHTISHFTNYKVAFNKTCPPDKQDPSFSPIWDSTPFKTANFHIIQTIFAQIPGKIPTYHYQWCQFELIILDSHSPANITTI